MGSSKRFKVPEYDRKTHTWLSEDQSFRVYKSYLAALTDRVAFLRSNARYTMAGLFKQGTKGNLRKEAMALQHGHYATDPEYARHIVAVFDGATMQTAIRDAKVQAAAHAAEATH
jgi:flagellum-specific peptidoglycan hydrolase FlgJ